MVFDYYYISLHCGINDIYKTSIEDNEKEPILTTIETTLIENMPFPAVTIATDGRTNPWGFIEKTFNMMTFYGPENEGVFEESKELRKEFQFLVKEMTETAYNEIEKQWQNWSLDDFKQYKPYNNHKTGLAKLCEEMKDLAPTIAAIYLKSPTIEKKYPIKEKIKASE